MAVAICDEGGGHEVRWRATRGQSLAGRTCPIHGTPLHGRKLGPTKGPLVACVACGRRRREGAETCIHPPVAFLIPGDHLKLYIPRQARVLHLEPGPHAAGSALCAWHPWEPAA